MKKQNGITLIALVVTIIVLLILAGVSITMVTGENGIITKARNAKEETRLGEVREIIDLWKAEVTTNEYDTNKGSAKTADELLQELLDEGKLKESEINRVEKTITINGKVISYKVNAPQFTITYHFADGTTKKLDGLYKNGDKVTIDVFGSGKGYAKFAGWSLTEHYDFSNGNSTINYTLPDDLILPVGFVPDFHYSSVNNLYNSTDAPDYIYVIGDMDLYEITLEEAS